MAKFKTKSEFIAPGVDLKPSDARYGFFATLAPDKIEARWNSEEGQRILHDWEASDFDRSTLDDRVGKYHGQTDLRGAVVSGKRLEEKDLSRIDFYAANLSKTNLAKSNLSDSWLSHADLRGTSLNFCRLDNALVDDVQFDNQTSFLGVNLNAINFNLAARLQALALRQLWISDIERHNPRIAFVLRMSCDYGRSFSRFACWALGAIIAFALFFYLTPHTINKSGFLESLYFSFVTFTTLGYGDIYPVSSLGMIAVILEVTLGYLMLGLLVAIFSKRVLGF